MHDEEITAPIDYVSMSGLTSRTSEMFAILVTGCSTASRKTRGILSHSISAKSLQAPFSVNVSRK